ncbi:MAG: heavy metal translocating P-type ATPase [Candidatus Bipolaricaulia bacterium]
MKTILKVKGMTCQHCVKSVTKALQGVAGVQSVTVSLERGRAEVEHSESVSTASLTQAVTDAGYEAEELSEDPEEDERLRPSPRSATTPLPSVKTGEGSGVRAREWKPYELTLPIAGMSCASCVAKVEKALKSVPGVLDASVNFATEKATVRVAANQVTAEKLKEAVRRIGYDVPEEKPEAHAHHHEEQLRRRLIVSAVLTVAIFFLMYPGMLGLKLPISDQWNYLLQLLLATPVQFWAGWQFYKGTWAALRNKTTDMNTLIAVGTTAAYGYSALLPLFGAHGHMDLYFDTSAAIITLILLGRVLEARAKGRTSEAIKKLIGLQAKTARVIRDGQEKDIPVEDVQVGDLIIVRPGEKIPVDGIVIDGASAVD